MAHAASPDEDRLSAVAMQLLPEIDPDVGLDGAQTVLDIRREANRRHRINESPKTWNRTLYGLERSGMIYRAQPDPRSKPLFFRRRQHHQVPLHDHRQQQQSGPAQQQQQQHAHQQQPNGEPSVASSDAYGSEGGSIHSRQSSIAAMAAQAAPVPDGAHPPAARATGLNPEAAAWAGSGAAGGAPSPFRAPPARPMDARHDLHRAEHHVQRFEPPTDPRVPPSAQQQHASADVFTRPHQQQQQPAAEHDQPRRDESSRSVLSPHARAMPDSKPPMPQFVPVVGASAAAGPDRRAAGEPSEAGGEPWAHPEVAHSQQLPHSSRSQQDTTPPSASASGTGAAAAAAPAAKREPNPEALKVARFAALLWMGFRVLHRDARQGKLGAAGPNRPEYAFSAAELVAAIERSTNPQDGDPRIGDYFEPAMHVLMTEGAVRGFAHKHQTVYSVVGDLRAVAQE